MAEQLAMVNYLHLDCESPHLVAHRCVSCSALFFDRRTACAHCSGRKFEEQELADRGVVRAFTIVHRAAPGIPAPFVSVVVDLDGGGRVKANLIGTDATPESVRPGMPVTLTTFVAGTDDEGTDAVCFGFRPERAGDTT